MLRKVEKDQIANKVLSLLEKEGLSQNESKIVISHLLDGELSGHSSHGFYRVPGIVKSLRKNGASKTEMVIENQTPVSGLVNGSGHLGLVVAEYATKVAVEKAIASKIAIVGAYNYIGTTGSMGYYNRIAADKGYIALVVCNSSYAMPPWGGKKAILGTNPISISTPSTGDPIIADMATSAMSYGDLALAMQEGRKVPEGVVINEHGYPSHDPNDADNGAQLPMAGHKGYSLALMIEILAGPLVKAKAGRDAVPGSDGFLVIVIDPGIFTDRNQFFSHVDALKTELKSSPLAPGYDEILLPGEKSSRIRKQNKDAQYIEVQDSVIRAIEAL